MMHMNTLTFVGACLALRLCGLLSVNGAAQPGVSPAPAPQREPGTASRPMAGDFDSRAAAFGGHGWVTRPNRDAVMAFTFPVEIAQVAVRTGDRVNTGQLLIRARDGEASTSLAVQKVRAENDAGLTTAQANLELAKLRFEAAERAKLDNAINPQEFE
ncbi:hypothetical protein, partial [Nostoc sp. CHAB 5715]|uniref:hypothetical protein n=1 Tax=Nostoc sp. CHAB 5715 TaxID=2780400 RepID=UPI001E4E874F